MPVTWDLHCIVIYIYRNAVFVCLWSVGCVLYNTSIWKKENEEIPISVCVLCSSFCSTFLRILQVLALLDIAHGQTSSWSFW